MISWMDQFHLVPQLRFELSNEIYAPALGKHPFFTFCHSCLPSESRKIYSTSFCTLSSLSLQFKPSTAKWCKVSRALPCWLVASLPTLGEGAPKCSICHLWVSHESPCHILPYLKHLKTCEIAWNRNIFHMGMDQYLLIPFLVGWTSIYQLFWCSPGVQGFDTLPYLFPHFWGNAVAQKSLVISQDRSPCVLHWLNPWNSSDGSHCRSWSQQQRLEHICTFWCLVHWCIPVTTTSSLVHKMDHLRSSWYCALRWGIKPVRQNTRLERI